MQDTSLTVEPLQVLWMGDAAAAQSVLAYRAPHIRLTERSTEGEIDSLLTDAATADLLVIDTTVGGVDTLGTLGRLAAADIDLPVVLLAAPYADDLAERAGRLAVCDVVVKTADFALQLLPAMTQARARHDLRVLFRSGRESQERLRTILEFQPAVTCVITPDGVLSAINLAGLTLLGVEREQAGRRMFASLLPPTERERVMDLVRRVCLGETGEIDHLVVRPDGRTLAVRTLAVPCRQGDAVVALATIVDRTAMLAETAALTEDRKQLMAALYRAEVDTDVLQKALEESRAQRAALEGRLAREQANWQQRITAALDVGRTASGSRAADHATLLQLRVDLARFMTDMDDRCRALIERQAATREPDDDAQPSPLLAST